MAESFVTNGFAKTISPAHIADGELFIIGRIKDPLIVYGSNNYPDDIDATSGKIRRSACAGAYQRAEFDRLDVTA